LNLRTKDREIFEKLIRVLEDKKPSLRSSPELVTEVAKFFLGTPYGTGTLETKGAERLTVNLREVDCFTFVENVVVLSRLFHSKKKSFGTFLDLLKNVRYRRGRMQGYPSRLHYFSDWIHDNQKKGIVRDVTAEVGGRPAKMTIYFMTSHPDLYPALRDAANLRKMKSVERTVSARTTFFIPKKNLRRFEKRIRDGDVIAITTRTYGLDVQHVGIAARVNNRIHLLHASSVEARVTLSSRTLYGYLIGSMTRSGIMVVRVL
jgi:hypothetical protein